MTMKLSIVAVVVCGAMLSVAGVEAQTPAPRRDVVIGCVSVEAGTPPTFAIRDIRSEKPLKYKLDGDSQQLRIHAGHLVEIAGPMSSDRPLPAVKVQSLIYLSPRCPK